MKYQITAADEQGNTSSFIIADQSPEAIRKLLADRGLFPLKMELEPFSPAGIFSEENFRRWKFRLNRTGYLREFSRLLASLIKSGMPLVEALSILSEKTGSRGKSENNYFNDAVSGVKKLIESGISLSLALSRYPDVFDEMFTNSVSAGETTGNIGEVMDRVSDYYSRKQAMNRRLLSAMTYPAVIILFSIVALGYLFIKVVPVYAGMFEDMGTDLPLISQVVFGLAGLLASYFPVWLAALIFSVMGINHWLKSSSGREVLDRWVLKIPLISKIVKLRLQSIFYRTSSLLINSGLPVINALVLSRQLINNQVLRNKVEESLQMITEGYQIGKAFEASEFAEGMLPRLIRTGEESGNLKDLFGYLADELDTELDSLTTVLTGLFEPIILVAVILSVSVVIIAILLPMLTAATMMM